MQNASMGMGNMPGYQNVTWKKSRGFGAKCQRIRPLIWAFTIPICGGIGFFVSLYIAVSGHDFGTIVSAIAYFLFFFSIVGTPIFAVLSIIFIGKTYDDCQGFRAYTVGMGVLAFAGFTFFLFFLLFIPSMILSVIGAFLMEKDLSRRMEEERRRMLAASFLPAPFPPPAPFPTM